MYLGWQQWHQAVNDGHSILADDTNISTVLSPKQRFLTGLFTNLTNPKGIVFMVAVLPQFIAADRPLLLQLAILIATTVSIDVIVMHVDSK
jgi:homoserine/homoserine lactone efflux protein